MAQQTEQQKTDIVAQKIKQLYNSHDMDGIYSLTNAKFQQAIPLSTLKKAFEEQVFINGKIDSLHFVETTNGASKYRLVMANGKWMRLIVALDGAGSIGGFAMQPLEEGHKQQSPKDFYHDNALQTNIDSIVHNYASHFMQTSSAPGLSIGVLIRRKAYFYNYGDAKKGQNVHPTKNTVFEIGSITKTFTAFLLADAVTTNKVKLGDPITNYLPDSVAQNTDLQKITIGELANHTSGLPPIPTDLLAVAKDQNNPYAQYGYQNLYGFLKRHKATEKPGKKYGYSNLAFGLLGVILEKINGQPLEAQYRQLIFGPLQMTSTYSTPIRIKDSLTVALGYDANGERASYWDFGALAGCGAIKSTTEDLLKYAASFALMPETKGGFDARTLLLQKITTTGKAMPVSLGWHFFDFGTSAFTMWHNGGTGGFRSYLAVMPSKRLAIVLLSNGAAEPGVASTGKELMETFKGQLANDIVNFTQ